jgi:hypothetical protein
LIASATRLRVHAAVIVEHRRKFGAAAPHRLRADARGLAQLLHLLALQSLHLLRQRVALSFYGP